MKQLVTEYLTLTRLNTERPEAFATRENKPTSPTRPSSSASTAATKVSTISQTLCSTTEQIQKRDWNSNPNAK
jgi:hypothetical protein